MLSTCIWSRRRAVAQSTRVFTRRLTTSFCVTKSSDHGNTPCWRDSRTQTQCSASSIVDNKMGVPQSMSDLSPMQQKTVLLPSICINHCLSIFLLRIIRSPFKGQPLTWFNPSRYMTHSCESIRGASKTPPMSHGHRPFRSFASPLYAISSADVLFWRATSLSMAVHSKTKDKYIQYTQRPQTRQDKTPIKRVFRGAADVI